MDREIRGQTERPVDKQADEWAGCWLVISAKCKRSEHWRRL